MMKLLITGGAGYIGAALLQKLSAVNEIESITVYDNLSNSNYNIFWKQFGLLSNKIRFVFGDILDSRSLTKEVKKHDAVIHLASKVAPAYSDVDSHSYEQVNHWGTAELVYAIEQSNVSKLIHLSSAAVYGPQSELITENTALNPKSFYGISKMRGEEHVRRLESKLNTVTYRVANVYGFSPAMSFDTVINKFLFESHFKNRISIHGNGLQTRCFINIDKITDTILQTLLGNIPSGVYNLSDKNIQILDIVDSLKELYPSLEFIFMNQHIVMKDQKVEKSTLLNQFIQPKDTDFKDELIEFKNNFSFSPSF